MARSNIEDFESSVQDGMPVECYKFSYNGVNYMYTNAARDISLEIEDGGKTRTEKYFAEYIRRETIKPGAMGSPTDCAIAVSKDHTIAKLFQGPPPEGNVLLTVYRAHLGDTGRFDIALSARIQQVRFNASECELTARQENWLNKEIPNGMYQYYCNSVVFDSNCGLNRRDWEVEVVIDEVQGIQLHSRVFAAYPDGYFTGGRVHYENYVRMVESHAGNQITLKYPFAVTPHNKITVLPGCDQMFKTCASRFKNHANFSGCPYVPPTDPEKNPTGKGAYWIDSLVVQRDTNGFVGSISL